MKNIDKLINSEFINEDNIDKVILRLEKAVKVGLKFKTRDKVINYKTYEQIKDLILEPIPESSTPFEKVLSQFESKIANNSTNFGSKNFMAFPDAGNAISSMTGAILLNFLNQNLINAKHCAPAATFVEIAVLQWFRELVGFPVIKDPKNIFDVGGAIVTGGVMANTTAMLLAREKKWPGTKDKGIIFDPSKIKVIIPDYVNHYSIKASLGWLGLGQDNIVTVKSDKFRINLDDLREKLKKYKNKYEFMALVAYAGDSRSMTIDNLKELHKITKKENIWFHVDACHGFQYAFSDKLKHKIDGIDLADSVSADPHKVLFCPYNISVVLTKNPHAFKTISGASDLITAEDFAFGQTTPMLGSKNFSSLKLWFLLKTLGRKNIGKLIEKRHEIAQYLADRLNENDNFIVLNKEVNINSVIFMYVPKHLKSKVYGNKSLIKKLNIFNKTLQNIIFTKGDFYVHTFTIPDLDNVLGCGEIILNPLRFMGGNPLTRVTDIDNLLIHIHKEGLKLEKINQHIFL